MTTRAQSHSDTRTYARLGDIPSAEQEQIMSRLLSRHAPSVAAKYVGRHEQDIINAARDAASDIYLGLLEFEHPRSKPVAAHEKFVVDRYYFYGPLRLTRYLGQYRDRRACSLDALTEMLGDDAMPESAHGMPTANMTETDVVYLLGEFGVHEDWLHVYVWVELERYSWPEVVVRIRRRRRIRIDEETMRKRWSRLRADLGPRVAAGLAGLPLDAFRLKAGHWATMPMKEPSRRSVDAFASRR